MRKNQVAGDFHRRGIDVKMVHVRTRNLLEKLASQDVDLVCGSVLDTEGADRLADYDVQEWRRSGLVLVTNLPPSRLPARTMGIRELPTLPLVLPDAGLVTDFVRGWFGEDYRDRLDVVAEIDTAQYGFELLRSGLVHGCMLVTQGIGEAAMAGRLAQAAGLRLIQLIGDLEPKMSLLVGVFARRGERAAQPAEHPLNLLWTPPRRFRLLARESRPTRLELSAGALRGSVGPALFSVIFVHCDNRAPRGGWGGHRG
jgi:hypothetical protein